MRGVENTIENGPLGGDDNRHSENLLGCRRYTTRRQDTGGGVLSPGPVSAGNGGAVIAGASTPTAR